MKKVNDKLVLWTSILVIVLLLVYAATMFASVGSIISNVKSSSEQPFIISQSIGKIKIYTTSIQAQVNRLRVGVDTERVDSVEKVLTLSTQNMNEEIEKIKGYSPDAQKLVVLSEQLTTSLNELIAKSRETDVMLTEVVLIISEKVTVKIVGIESLADAVWENTQRHLEETAKDTNAVYTFSIIWSSILFLAIVAALTAFYFVMRRNSEKETTLRRELQNALNSARGANSAKSQFLSNMSHDIRTPLNAVVGMTSIAQMHLGEPERVKDCLDKITLASRHLLGLINEVLDMSKIESGKVVLAQEEFNIANHTHDWMTIIAPQIRSKQLTLDVRSYNIRRECVVGDPIRLNQILINILGNAVKFTPNGGKISVVLEELAPDDGLLGRYRYTVADTGVGISKEFLAKMFEPFERESNSTISRTEGMGLGMSITKSLIEMMNGTIQVKSEEGKGTSIIIEIPMEQKACTQLPGMEKLKNKKVLFVNFDNRGIKKVGDMLQQVGVTYVDGATDDSGQNQTAAQADFVLVDTIDAETEGVRLVREVRSKNADIPVILLSAADWEEWEDTARSAGVTYFLKKPVFRSKLYRALIEVLQDGKREIPQILPTKFVGRVLIVEDNDLNMEITVEIMQQMGLRADQAWNGQQALDMVMHRPQDYFNLIFMDVQMPVMDGNAATEAIRKFERQSGRKRLPIVAMTANAFHADMKKALESGMNAYITKPVQLDEIKTVLLRFLYPNS